MKRACGTKDITICSAADAAGELSEVAVHGRGGRHGTLKEIKRGINKYVAAKGLGYRMTRNGPRMD